MRQKGFWLIVLMGLIGCGGDGGRRVPLPSFRIAFVSGRDGNREIYTMNPDGSDQKRLTFHPAYDLSPTWSPDRKTIAFLSDRTGTFHIYLMDPDGKRKQRLTEGKMPEGSPSFSPDGTKIVFVRWDGDADLIIRDLMTGRERKLTDDPNSLDGGPFWGPDGRIYFVRLPFSPNRSFPPSSFPDDPGKPSTWVRIGLLPPRRPFLGNALGDVWRIKPDGKGLQRVTEGLPILGRPLLSPDAQTLGLLLSLPFERSGIFFFPLPEGKPLKGTEGKKPFVSGVIGAFSFSPDGQALAFAAVDGGGDSEIFVIRKDGKVRKLTDNESFDGDPAW